MMGPLPYLQAEGIGGWGPTTPHPRPLTTPVRPGLAGGGPVLDTTPDHLKTVPVPGAGGPGVGTIALAALQSPEIQKLLGMGAPQAPQFAPPPMPMMPRPQWAPPVQAAPIAPLASMFA